MTETSTANLAEWLLEQIAEDEQVARKTGEDPVDSEHQARWPPARVLAECEAKRKTIEHINEQHDSAHGEPGSFLPPEWAEILKILALPFADRPGYRPEWRPE